MKYWKPTQRFYYAETNNTEQDEKLADGGSRQVATVSPDLCSKSVGKSHALDMLSIRGKSFDVAADGFVDVHDGPATVS